MGQIAWELAISMNPISNSMLKLQTDFYSPECVTQALADFGEYLSGSWELSGDEMHVQVRVTPYYAAERSRILREFLNYVLDLSLKLRFADAQGKIT